MLGASQAFAATNSVTWTGPSDFDTETITFPGFVANELTSITGPGYYHNHSFSSPTFTMEVQLDGVWTQIFSDTPPSSVSDFFVTAIPTPISFSLGTVTGIRFSVSLPVGAAYHSFAPTFIFNGASSDQTERIIANYLSQRADVITANDPDLTQRLTQGGNAGGGQGPLGFVATGTDDNARLSISTSLSRIANAHSAAAAMAASGGRSDAAGLSAEKGSESRFALPYDSPGDSGAFAQLRPSFDIWVQGTYAHTDESTRESDVGLLHAGADYLINPSLLIGVMAQADWVEQDDSAVNSSIDGTGWMAGPYIVVRLHQNVLFDARAAWGQSFNDISPLGTYTDSFDTERWLARAQLTGDFHAGNWVFAPHARVLYFEDTAESYTDSLGVLIPGQTVTLGRFTFGPKVGYTIAGEGGSTFEPYVGIEGIWDFDDADTVDPTTGLTAFSEDLRARVEAGVTAAFKGWSLTGEGFYDGIGVDGMEAYGGRARVGIAIH